LSISESQAQRYQLRDPDIRLMLAVRDDDAGAFEELMRRYQNRLITVLEHLVGRREDAEDLAQEVFLRVYRARKSYSVGSLFSTWLFTIANNVASNARRGRARRREVRLDTRETGALSVRPLENVAVASSGLMPSRRLDDAEMQDVIRAAMSTLNDRQRMALLLNKFEDMCYADIAQVMSLTPQAVKSLLCRARLALRDVLEAYLERGQWPAEAGVEGEESTR
jgi:RNA polymerase sigma-70 factor (ECF subfamily)